MLVLKFRLFVALAFFIFGLYGLLYHSTENIDGPSEFATYLPTANSSSTIASNVSYPFSSEKCSGTISPAQDLKSPPYAFVSFLSMTNEDGDLDDPVVYNDKVHFIAARMLAYQLLHAPETRTKKNYPFIVAVTPEITQGIRSRLVSDGAQVIEVEHLTADWISPEDRYSTVMTKIRIASWTQFDLVLFLDLDTVLTQNLDGVFEDPAVQVLPNLHLEREGQKSTMKEDEGPQPESYVFAGTASLSGNHGFPPREAEMYLGHWANAGFWIIHPSKDLYNHYLTVLSIPDRFQTFFPEEGLLNYVHRDGGNMPWLQLDFIWNTAFAWKGDFDAGVKSLHRKWWAESGGLEDYFHQIRWQMDGYFKGMDAQGHTKKANALCTQ